MTYHQTAARIRAERDLPPGPLAAAVGLPIEEYLVWEQTGEGKVTTHGLTMLAEALGVHLSALGGWANTRAADTLGQLWSTWGPDGGGRRAALAAVTSWASADDYLTMCATPQDMRVDCVAARGVPEAPPSIFTTPHLPAVDVPILDDDAVDLWLAHQRAGRTAAAQMASLAGADQFDPWLAAHRAGVPVGLAPMGPDLFSATVRVGEGFAIVVNSDFAENWRTEVLTHALLHLAAGHVGAASDNPVPDRDDDSIYACGGTDWRTCATLDHATAWLLDPEWATANLARAERDAHDDEPADEPEPEPTRAPGEPPAPWEEQDVYVPPVVLRRELGYTHPAHMDRGAGEERWPAQLAARWTACSARWVHDVAVAVKFPFGKPGCPTVADVEAAIRRGRIALAQVNAMMDGQTAAMLTEALPD